MKTKMEIIDIHKFDYEKRRGEILYCVELVTNDSEEISKQTYAFESEEIAIKECEILNKLNKDKEYKYIQSNYEVCDNELNSI